MSTWTWVLILGFGLIKLPIALLMLWLPFRNDASLVPLPTPEENDSAGEDDGGSKTLPGAPRRPSPTGRVHAPACADRMARAADLTARRRRARPTRSRHTRCPSAHLGAIGV